MVCLFCPDSNYPKIAKAYFSGFSRRRSKKKCVQNKNTATRMLHGVSTLFFVLIQYPAVLTFDKTTTVVEVDSNPEHEKEDNIGCPLTHEFFTSFVYQIY